MEILFYQTNMLAKAIGAIKIVKGDITASDCDAIVCPDNTALSASGGVSAAVRKAAGPQLGEVCRKLKYCKVGEAKITGGYQLKARHVIHTAGPVWNGGQDFEELQLARCYLNSLEAAIQADCSSVAFASISTGHFMFPLQRAAEIAVYVLLRKLYACMDECKLESVEIVCFEETVLEAFRQAFRKAIVEAFLECYSPEGCALYDVSELDMSLYWNGMMKLADLEPNSFQYGDYTDKFQHEANAALSSREQWYLAARECGEWDYRTCLAYIIILQRRSYWSGGREFLHGKQCSMGSIRKVLLRMRQLLAQNDSP